MNQKKTAVIIGAGPAGLTAAYELLTRSDVGVIVIEQSDYMGGISRTVRYKGNRIDIGGHRFFSKSDRVMNWWMNILPVAGGGSNGHTISYQKQSRTVTGAAPEPDADKVLLVRPRKSRIYYLRRFFEYPLSLSADTISKLGLLRTFRIGMSYLRALLMPIRPERSLQDFLINRFGRELYLTFFKSYTEKVWGVPCDQISAEWGAQRIKGLSIRKAIEHMLKSASRKGDIKQKETETSLIEQFLYPKFGPGQMWEEVARRVTDLGGEIATEYEVVEIEHDGSRVNSVLARHTRTGDARRFHGDYFFSTMPVKQLIASCNPAAPAEVQRVSQGLVYRDFITVGLLCDRLRVTDPAAAGGLIRDNWIYVQEPGVLVGRLQIFNNWSPYMVADPSKVWVGLEYFCYETDELWRKSDSDLVKLAVAEMESMGMLKSEDVLDATVIRMPKTYPAYFGSYDEFPVIRSWVDVLSNLFLVGRNGMHKYNNQDHSMLTAMMAVDNIIAGITDKENLWAVNTEVEYHEEKADTAQSAAARS